MVRVPTVLHFVGYSLAEMKDTPFRILDRDKKFVLGKYHDWERVCWGNPLRGELGRIPALVRLALTLDPVCIIWSGGANKIENGPWESEYSFEIAMERYDWYSCDYPEHFHGLLPSQKVFEEFFRTRSVFDTSSVNTGTTFESVTKFIDKAIPAGFGIVMPITSSNHTSRVVRDAHATWKDGRVIERFIQRGERLGHGTGMRIRYSPPLKNRLIQIVSASAETKYADGMVENVFIDELGR